MTSSGNLISIIIPIYNASPYLRQALSSVLQQPYKNLEILCINDGSTDNSLDIIKEFAGSDNRIKVIDKENQGYGASCNRGIDEATGDWIAILEPDDWIEGDMFGSLIRFAGKLNTPVDIVKSAYWRIVMPDTSQESRQPCGYMRLVNPRKQPFGIEKAVHLLDSHPSIWSAIYRRDFLDVKKIRFREYPGAGWADNPFLIETLCQTGRIAYLDQAFYCYREDTPQKVKDFTQKFPTLPLHRWCEMKNSLEKIGVKNKKIIEAHNRRGVAYLDVIIENLDEIDSTTREAIDAVISEIDADLVLNDAEIPPQLRSMFANLAGLPAPHISKWKDRFKLLWLNLHSRGLTATLDTILGK